MSARRFLEPATKACEATAVTDLIYMETLDNAYVSALRAKIVEVGPGFVLLDRSIFYPEGGGQPSDRGVIRAIDPETGASTAIEVTKIEKKHGVRHLVNGDTAPLRPGMDVVEELDWARRVVDRSEVHNGPVA